jgi:hypothetical protein
MKYLKISSLLVLSLLLFAPAAQADVECNLSSEGYDLRAESRHEMLGNLEVRCSWEDNDFADGTATSQPMFSLDITFSEDISNPDDMQPYLEFTGMADGTGGTTATTKVMPNDIGSDDIEWDDVAFPFANADADPATTWANGDWEDQNSGEFWIKGVYLDASGGDDEVTASIRMTVPSASLSSNATFDSDRDEVDVADIDAGMELSFTDKHDKGEPGKPNACNPAKFTIAVDVEEGYRSAWMAQNDILLSLSSGSMKDLAKTGVTGALEDTEEGGDGELLYEVTNTSGDNTASLTIEITPVVGEEGDDITLSAEFLPMRRSGEEFDISDELVVGTYAACKGESLFFPFVTSMSGWDTGIAITNDSKVNGSCSLNWGNIDLDEDEMEALSTIDVKSKDHAAFRASDHQTTDYSGSLGVQCTFNNAYGYIFLNDIVNGIGQGYLVTP